MTSQLSALAGGLSFKKAESYYWVTYIILGKTVAEYLNFNRFSINKLASRHYVFTPIVVCPMNRGGLADG